MKYPLFLTGFMASGKSSKGKKLARALNIPFIDLDEEIEKQENCSITELFRERGEAYFREKETDILKSFSEGKKLVIALGGGTVCNSENLSFVKNNGTLIYLKKSEERLLGRLRQNKSKRPLVSQLNDDELKLFIKNKLKERSFYYEQADLVVDSDELKVSELKEKLLTL